MLAAGSVSTEPLPGVHMLGHVSMQVGSYQQGSHGMYGSSFLATQGGSADTPTHRSAPAHLDE